MSQFKQDIVHTTHAIDYPMSFTLIRESESENLYVGMALCCPILCHYVRMRSDGHMTCTWQPEYVEVIVCECWPYVQAVCTYSFWPDPRAHRWPDWFSVCCDYAGETVRSLSLTTSLSNNERSCSLFHLSVGLRQLDHWIYSCGWNSFQQLRVHFITKVSSIVV